MCASSRTKGLFYFRGCLFTYVLFYGLQLVKVPFGSFVVYVLFYFFGPLGEEAVCHPIGSYMQYPAAFLNARGPVWAHLTSATNTHNPHPGAVSSHREPHAVVRSVLWMLGRLHGHSSPTTTTHQPSLVCGWGATSE